MLKFDSILIRFGELSTKGKNKKDFVIQLYKNIKTALQDFEGLSFTRSHDRIYVKLNNEDPNSVAEILKDSAKWKTWSQSFNMFSKCSLYS